MHETKTIIGQGALIRGMIEGEEDIVIEGRVEGTVSLSAELIINPGAVVQADVSARSVTVMGILIGNVDAQDTVRIAEGGKMAGDIRAPGVVLEEGSAFNGKVDMGEFSMEPEMVSEPVRPQAVTLPTRPLSISPRSPFTGPAPMPKRELEPEPSAPERPQQLSAGFSRPPMPVPSRPAPVPYPSAPPKRQGAPEPRVRPVGRVKIKRPTV